MSREIDYKRWFYIWYFTSGFIFDLLLLDFLFDLTIENTSWIIEFLRSVFGGLIVRLFDPIGIVIVELSLFVLVMIVFLFIVFCTGYFWLPLYAMSFLEFKNIPLGFYLIMFAASLLILISIIASHIVSPYVVHFFQKSKSYENLKKAFNKIIKIYIPITFLSWYLLIGTIISYYLSNFPTSYYSYYPHQIIHPLFDPNLVFLWPFFLIESLNADRYVSENLLSLVIQAAQEGFIGALILGFILSIILLVLIALGKVGFKVFQEQRSEQLRLQKVRILRPKEHISADFGFKDKVITIGEPDDLTLTIKSKTALTLEDVDIKAGGKEGRFMVLQIFGNLPVELPARESFNMTYRVRGEKVGSTPVEVLIKYCPDQGKSESVRLTPLSLSIHSPPPQLNIEGRLESPLLDDRLEVGHQAKNVN